MINNNTSLSVTTTTPKSEETSSNQRPSSPAKAEAGGRTYTLQFAGLNLLLDREIILAAISNDGRPRQGG